MVYFITKPCDTTNERGTRFPRDFTHFNTHQTKRRRTGRAQVYLTSAPRYERSVPSTKRRITRAKRPGTRTLITPTARGVLDGIFRSRRRERNQLSAGTVSWRRGPTAQVSVDVSLPLDRPGSYCVLPRRPFLREPGCTRTCRAQAPFPRASENLVDPPQGLLPRSMSPDIPDSGS